MRWKSWARLAVLVAVTAAGIHFWPDGWGGDASAQTSPTLPAPPVNIFEAACFRSVVEDDDLLCIERYQLPQQSTPAPTPVAGAEAWCAELLNQGGCNTNPVVPTAPASLLNGKAFVTLCNLTGTQNGCFSATDPGTLYGQNRAPRISYALGGVYLLPGHNVTWGDPAVHMCIESGTFFSATATACLGVDFNSEPNVKADQRAALEEFLPLVIRTIELQRNLPENTLIINAKVSTSGRVLALEAYPFMDTIAPNAFQAVAQPAVTTPFSATSTPSALQQALAATATAVAFDVSTNEASEELLGISGGFWWTLVFALLGLAGMSAAIHFGLPMVIGVWILGWTCLIGVFVNGPSPSVIAVTIVLLAFPAIWFVLRRVPTG